MVSVVGRRLTINAHLNPKWLLETYVLLDCNSGVGLYMALLELGSSKKANTNQHQIHTSFCCSASLLAASSNAALTLASFSSATL